MERQVVTIPQSKVWGSGGWGSFLGKKGSQRGQKDFGPAPVTCTVRTFQELPVVSGTGSCRIVMRQRMRKTHWSIHCLRSFPFSPVSSHPAASCWHQLLPLLFPVSAETPHDEDLNSSCALMHCLGLAPTDTYFTAHCMDESVSWPWAWSHLEQDCV